MFRQGASVMEEIMEDLDDFAEARMDRSPWVYTFSMLLCQRTYTHTHKHTAGFADARRGRTNFEEVSWFAKPRVCFVDLLLTGHSK